jgi:hypothetical protein
MPHEEQIVTRNQPDPGAIEGILQLLAEAARPRDPREELLESLFAQQDATDVSRRVTETQEPGSVMDLLAALGETAIDFTPGVGDVKAVAVDAPEQFGSGQNIAGIISILSALPGVGILGDLARSAGKGVGRGASRMGSILDNIANARTGGAATGRVRGSNAIDELLGLGRRGGPAPGGAARVSGDPSSEAFDRLINQLEGGGGAARSAPNPDLEAIRSEIFQSLKRPDPFGDNAAQHEALIEQILELARKRGGG